MKYLTILFLALVTAMNVNGQVLTEEQLIGTWAVSAASYIPNDYTKDQLRKVEPMREAFLRSNFVFRKNKHCSFDFDFEDLAVKDGHWKLDKTTNTIIIRAWKDRETDGGKLLMIIPQKEGDKVAFLIEETILKLEVKKQ